MKKLNAVVAWLCLLASQFTPALRAADSATMFAGVKRVVFLCDSITYSGAYVETIEAYFVTRFPEREVEFINVGLPSETVSGLSEDGHAGGQFPRPDLHERLDRVLAQLKPDQVVACYGMNDGIYLPFDEGRFAKYREGIQRLRDKCVAAGAKILHVTPPTFDEVKGGHPGYGNTLDRYSDWLLTKRADGWDVVDLHGPMNRYLAEQRAKDPSFFLAGDGVHCGDVGHWIIARQILLHLGANAVAVMEDPKAMLAQHPNGEALLKLIQQRQRMMKDSWLTAIGHKRPGMSKGLPLADAQTKAAELDRQLRALATPYPGKQSAWNGYNRYDFEVAGRPVLVVVPREVAPGKPWVWHGEFFGHKPAPDIALLGQGFHIVYMSVPDMLGAPDAVSCWNAFYQELTTKHGFAKKAALVGLSRGGLYCYNWAIANPDKVACIYADAPVCDFKSWPGGRGKGKGSPRDWELVLKAYHFKDEAEALAYRANPVDKLGPLADAAVPLLHVFGDADDVVPWEENTGLVAERYQQLGGKITLIRKPGVGHHPHGLDDSTPIIEFIREHAAKQ